MEENSGSRKVQYLVLMAVSLAAVTSGVSVYWSTPMIPKFHDHDADLEITEVSTVYIFKPKTWVIEDSDGQVLHELDNVVERWRCYCEHLYKNPEGTTTPWPTDWTSIDLEPDILRTEDEASWMAAMSSPGYIIGSLGTSYVADKLGRRAALLGSAVPVAIGTVVLVCATEAWMLYLTRLLWGCGTGIYVTVSVIYLVEIADKDIRGKLSVGNRFMFNFGSFLVMSIGPFVAYSTLNYMLLALPVGYFVACWWIPETPYYYLKEGKVACARKELMLLRGYTDDKVLEDQLTLMQSDVKKEMRRSGTTKELFTGKQYRRAIIIAAGFKITQIMAGSIPIQQYLGRIMQESNADIPVSVALMAFGAVRFFFGILSSLVVDKIGRRPLLITTYIGACVCHIIVGIYFFFKEVVGIENESSSPYRYITFIGIIASNIIATLGFDSLIYVIPGEIFPINVKSIAMTSLNVVGGFMNFFVVKGYQELKNWTGLYGVFWYFALMSLIGAVFSYCVVIETKGKSLREIQIELQGNIYDEAEKCLNKVPNTQANGDALGDAAEMKEIVNNRPETCK